ncbi:HXXEE domain-containing protein [Geodermatophilus sp. DF01-2]|uniref:HXXEE domain-containing protein n=1 Tax=Geodermatophilus sp. DF01-2 TaxID=2559610 RepID=UPI0010749D35|nr:HXXEE domain-containing protein [Geodermatophilus sp. DF01_2]TFV63690.1 HXXEE domain-containing protein [Geodermatophilus sp. DF01_2]
MTAETTTGADSRAGRLLRTVTWGLFAAWALHDAEELCTMAGWADRARPRLEQNLPWVPAAVWDRMSVSQEHATAAIGVMACVIGTAAARGAHTNGRSPLYQATLAGFGLHAVPHLASAVVTRGYTPGVLTAPTVVAPFALWAWRRLRRAEVPIATSSSAGPPAGRRVWWRHTTRGGAAR